jgi:predicted HTH domain antitoxin
MTVEIPEAVEKALGDTPEAAQRRALECMVVEGYRSQKLSHRRVGELLGLSWHETEDLLARNGAMLHMTSKEVEAEVEGMLKLLGPK